jgi:uncharacterized protein YbaR (Trm112 family)
VALDPQLLDILACPDTHHAPLTYDAGADADVHRVRPDLRGPRRHPGPAPRRGRHPAGRRPDGRPDGRHGRRQRPPDADESLLDDEKAMLANDPGGMLRATASAGAQVRESAALAAEADLSVLADEGRPRAVVVAGIGTAGLTGNILATVAGPRCPVPIIGHRSAGVPGWVGAADVVIAVSASGRSPEALAAADAAARAAPGWSRSATPTPSCRPMAERARAPFIPVPRRAPARASLWGLTVPVLLAARSLGLVKVNEADLAETAPGSTPTPSAAAPAPSPSSTRRSRWPWAWPARSRSSGVRRRWPPWRPAASPTRWPPTPAIR